MEQGNFQEKDIFEDVLSTEKSLTGTYNTFANECSTAGIRDEFLNLLNEEHQIQAEVFDEMHKRGWYPTPQAEQQKVAQAKQKFENMKNQ